MKPAPAKAVSSERAALAARITEAEAAGRRAQGLASAMTNATEAVRKAEREVDAATEAMEQAHADAAQHLVSTAIGEDHAPPATVRDARNRLADAQDNLQAATAARAAIAGQAAQAANPLSAGWLRDAAVAVLVAETRPADLLAEVDRLQRLLAEKGAALQWLADAGAFPKTPTGVPTDPAVLHVLSLMSPLQWSALSAEQAAGRAAWESALARLMADAAAPLE